MKKIYIAIVSAVVAFSANAADLYYTVNGEKVENNAKIDLAPYWVEKDMQYNPHLYLETSEGGMLNVDVDFTKGVCTPAFDEDEWLTGAKASIAFCAIDGMCTTINPGKQSQKNGLVEAGKVDMQTELGIVLGDEEKIANVTVDAEYTMTSTLNGNTVSITFFVNEKLGAGASGVANVEIDGNAPAVYYDLQGRKVANPSKGLYIINRGGKVTKEVIR